MRINRKLCINLAISETVLKGCAGPAELTGEIDSFCEAPKLEMAATHATQGLKLIYSADR